MASIKDNILRMKDLSELMVDLAYTAVFLDDRRITTEVRKLSENINELEESTLKFLFRVRVADEERVSLINLIDYMKEISDAALHIAEMTEIKKFPEIIKDILVSSDKRVIVATITKASPLSNKPLSESRVRTTAKTRIIGVRRDNDWNFSINRDTILKTGDFVVAVGTKDSQEAFEKLANG